ncbi:hypothetical protein QVD17_30680 [Tagetes erecta]|uniref:Uncharacterized protein n=1 Tax=Tagetes erecta TaxID=13708 RepID=A0AAD8NN74_TARER|nr:hypothetical protein QVD17_30680 [Tagetes erecta]
MSQLPESSSSSLNRSRQLLADSSNETVAFKIDITKYNIDHGYPLYAILKYIDDMVIVTKLEDRFADDNAADTPSANRHSKFFLDEETPSNTEKTSVIDESNTPNVSVDKTFGKRIINEEFDEVPVDGRIVLKRNLKEVYDLDENEESSATKSRTNDEDSQLDSGKFLLIPKEEKKTFEAFHYEFKQLLLVF